MGAPRSAGPGAVDRVLREHADACYDFALAVTNGPGAAVDAVRQAVPAAVEAHGPDVTRAALLGSVLEAALRRTEPVASAPVLVEDVSPPASDSVGVPDTDDLRRVCRQATLALDPRDRAALDLTLRQGLEGEELSEALGVPPGLASATTQAALERAENVLGAMLLARVTGGDCPGLAAAVDWLTPEVDLDRLAASVIEHQEECASCADRRRALVPVASLLAGVPPTSAPDELRRRSEPGSRTLPRPRLRRGSRRRPMLRAVTAVLAGLVLAGAAAAVLRRDGDESVLPVAAVGGRLAIPATELDFGRAAVDASFEIVNRGPEALEFRARAGDPWLSLSAAAGTIAPGDRLRAVAVLDRSRAPEGDIATEIRVASTGGTAFVPVRAQVNRPPEVTGMTATPEWVVHHGCPGATPAQVRVSVVEESGTAQVVLHWRGPEPSEGSSAMAGDPQSSFVASLGPFPSEGDVTWWVSATDVRANVTASPPELLRVGGC